MNNKALKEVINIINIYFDALYYGDIEKFKSIMHPTVRLYCATNDNFVHMDLPEYMKLVDERPSSASRQDKRFDRILAIDLASPSTAHVRVETAYLPKHFIDELTLVCIKDRWWIVSKVWHYETRED